MSDDKKQLAKIALEQRAVAVLPSEPYRASEQELAGLSQRFGVPSVDLGRVRILLSLLELVPREIAEMHRLLVVDEEADTLHVAMENPSDQKSLDELSFVVGKRIAPMVVPAVDLEAALNSAYLAARMGERYFTGPHFDGPAPASRMSLEMQFVPVKRAEAAAPPMAPTSAPSRGAPVEPNPPAPREAVLDFEVPDLDFGGAETAPRPAPKAASATRPNPETDVGSRGPLVLIADSDEPSRRLLVELLSEKGYRTVCAKSGEEAVELIKQSPPDALVLDTFLSGLNGFELAQRLRASRRFARLPIVMTSGVPRGSALPDDLRRMGFEHHLQKPFRAASLSKALAAALGVPKRRMHAGAAERLQAGLSAFRAGDVKQALSELESAIEIDPEAPELHLHLGLLHGQRGQLFDAIASLERAAELDGHDFPCIKNLAILYQQVGLVNCAREVWQRALHLATDDSTRASIQDRLKSLAQ